MFLGMLQKNLRLPALSHVGQKIPRVREIYCSRTTDTPRGILWDFDNATAVVAVHPRRSDNRTAAAPLPPTVISCQDVNFTS